MDHKVWLKANLQYPSCEERCLRLANYLREASCGSGLWYEHHPVQQSQWELRLPEFYLASGNKGKNRYKKRNSLTALKRVCPPRGAAQNVVPRHLVGLQPSACTKCCMNVVIARRWLSKCGANLVACITHVVAKMFFTNAEALSDAWMWRLLALLFKNS